MNSNTYLIHYGVKGMKWGVRKGDVYYRLNSQYNRKKFKDRKHVYLLRDTQANRAIVDSVLKAEGSSSVSRFVSTKDQQMASSAAVHKIMKTLNASPSTKTHLKDYEKKIKSTPHLQNNLYLYNRASKKEKTYLSIGGSDAIRNAYISELKKLGVSGSFDPESTIGGKRLDSILVSDLSGWREERDIKSR